MLSARKDLWIWSCANALMIIIAVIAFATKLKKPYFSDDVSDWMSFSAYFNNILNPVLMSFYIFFLIKLTIVAANFNKKNLIDQLRHETYAEISKKLYGVAPIINSSTNVKRDLVFLKIDIISFTATMNHLFEIKDFKLISERLCTSLSEMAECYFLQNNGGDDNDYQNFIILFKQFDNDREFFMSTLRGSILKDTK